MVAGAGSPSLLSNVNSTDTFKDWLEISSIIFINIINPLRRLTSGGAAAASS